MNKQIISYIFATCCILSLLQGCTTTSTGKREIGVRFSNEGRIYVGDRRTGLKKMVKQLKADGAKKDDRIVISIPKNTSPNALKAIGRELASNGYAHILFKQEKQAIAQKGPDPYAAQ